MQVNLAEPAEVSRLRRDWQRWYHPIGIVAALMPEAGEARAKS